RALSSASGEVAVLVSVERSGAVRGVPEPGQTNPLCVTVSDGGICGTADSLRSGRFLVLAGDHVYGLVPDGVSRVVLAYPDGQSRSAEVRDNFFAVTDAPVTERPVPAPAGGTPPMKMSVPPSIRWLDDRGSPVGPPLAR